MVSKSLGCVYVAHWYHIWLQLQQLGFETRYPAKYCTESRKSGTERDPAKKKSLKKHGRLTETGKNSLALLKFTKITKNSKDSQLFSD